MLEPGPRIQIQLLIGPSGTQQYLETCCHHVLTIMMLNMTQSVGKICYILGGFFLLCVRDFSVLEGVESPLWHPLVLRGDA